MTSSSGDTLYEVQIRDGGRWVPAHGRRQQGHHPRGTADAIARELRGHGVKVQVVPVSYASNARRQRRNGDLSSLEIVIPDWNGEWRQIGGDMDPGAHGGTIATCDGNAIEVIKIQPVRDQVGDDEAKDVGFPFWSKEGYYDLDDLREAVGDRLLVKWVELDKFLPDLTPEQRAIAIAEAAMDYGFKSEESNAGWAKDVIGSRIVKWMSGTEQGYEYIADEDDEFRREVLGEEDDEEDEDEDDELEPNPGGFRTMADIKRANKAAGRHWFDKGALAFFRSKIEPKVYGGRYFITSEQFDDAAPRRYSVRMAEPDGSISTVGEFQAYDGRGAAEDAIDELLGHTPNSSNPDLEKEGTLDQLLEMQAETLEPQGSGRVPREVKNQLRITPELRRVVREYEAALQWALDEVVMRHPPNDGASAADLYADNAPYLVLMTLQGQGVGIWDGDWDSHYDQSQIKNVERTLKNKLKMYADDTGSGKIVEALNDAVYDAMREAGYGFDEHTYVPIADGGALDVDFEPNRRTRRPKGGSHARNASSSVRWNVFLNNEMLEPVFVTPEMTGGEVKAMLLAEGYDDRIVVDRPPERRTNLPPHYRTTPSGGTRLSANPKLSRATFDKARAAVLKARDERDSARNALERKYGGGMQLTWVSAGERSRYERLARAYDRASDRMHLLLEQSPRDWKRGVPTSWVVEDLSYEDAVRPASDPLSTEPPRAYGYN